MMVKSTIPFTSIVLLLTASGFTADLYKISVQSEQETSVLVASSAEPVIRLQGGYLILADSPAIEFLYDHKITAERLISNVNRRELALDIHHDRTNINTYQLVYEEDDFRIFRIDPLLSDGELESISLMRVENVEAEFKYISPGTDKSPISNSVEGLLELVALVNYDSLVSYTERLQAFEGRVCGTDSNYAAALWIASKFEEFGYDSTVVDSFSASSHDCQNVMAYKIGTHHPEHYIIVGAHYDAVEGSPGADDNGSGTAAVMEMARVIKDIDTDVTMVFILFDGEEIGFFGSIHYASEAYARGDSIIFMMNLDMIAHHENYNQAELFCGDNRTFALLWQSLADSLVGIEGFLSGNTATTDHLPFQQRGYTVICVHEYMGSDVLHSPRDSTTYLSFTYTTKMVQASLATIYSADQTAIPRPSVTFAYPDGLPLALVPDQSTVFEVIVDSLHNGIPVPGTGKIHYIVNEGALTGVSMTEDSTNHYTAILPALSCGDTLRYYISAEETTEGIIYDPNPLEPFRAFPATEHAVIYFDDFESDQGWTVSGGLWERGTPIGGGGDNGYPDPTGGYNSPSVFGYNLEGDYTDNMPEYSITSPPLDLSGLMGVTLSFYRWLDVDNSIRDKASLQVSRDGIDWTTMWTNTDEVTDNSWTFQEFDISSVADNQPAVHIRFTMGPTNISMTYCGWNIDDFAISAYSCESCPIPIEITTVELPRLTVGYQSNIQLTAIGGIGEYTWSDKYNDLAGTGLDLSASGLLSGSPYSSGILEFTASVNDALGCFDEKLFSIEVNSFYVRGDANNDGEANIGDAVFIINYVFIGGAPPQMLNSADANSDCDINVGDAVYLINYVFVEGPVPGLGCVNE